MKELIIATDLYENSDNNVYTGYHFARKIECRPTLYHIDTYSGQIETLFHPSNIHTEYVMDKDWEKEIEVTTLARVRDQLNRLGIDKQNVYFENFEGSINDGIDHLNTHPFLRAMSVGKNQDSSFHRTFFNTFTEKAYSHMHKELLLVKKICSNFENIVYLISHKHHKKDHDQIVHTLAKKLGANVHLEYFVPNDLINFDLNVFSTTDDKQSTDNKEKSKIRQYAEEFLKKIKNNFENEGVTTSYSTEMATQKDASKTMTELLEQKKSELVLMHPGHNILADFFSAQKNTDLIQEVNTNFYLLPH